MVIGFNILLHQLCVVIKLIRVLPPYRDLPVWIAAKAVSDGISTREVQSLQRRSCPSDSASHHGKRSVVPPDKDPPASSLAARAGRADTGMTRAASTPSRLPALEATKSTTSWTSSSVARMSTLLTRKTTFLPHFLRRATWRLHTQTDTDTNTCTHRDRDRDRHRHTHASLTRGDIHTRV